MLRMNDHRNHRAWAQLRCQITELSVNQNSPLIVDAQKRKSDNWISAAYRSGYTYINARIMRRLIIIQLSSIILPSYEGVCWLSIENFRTETGPFYLKWNNDMIILYNVYFVCINQMVIFFCIILLFGSLICYNVYSIIMIMWKHLIF